MYKSNIKSDVDCNEQTDDKDDVRSNGSWIDGKGATVVDKADENVFLIKRKGRVNKTKSDCVLVDSSGLFEPINGT